MMILRRSGQIGLSWLLFLRGSMRNGWGFVMPRLSSGMVCGVLSRLRGLLLVRERRGSVMRLLVSCRGFWIHWLFIICPIGCPGRF
ncbi:hypothetical protein EGT56_04060 [Arachnia propionica]|nr:hypothetical protein EGT56_04060 [Arachnia propionica]